MSYPGAAPLTAEQVAQRLGVSSTRVRQLVRERKLAEPMALSDRVHLWWPVDVEAAKALMAGQVMSVRADLLDELETPLTRVADHIVRYPLRSEPAVVHVRIWSGNGPEGHRTVVLLGSMRETVGIQSRIEDIVTIVSDRFLRGRADQAVWLEYNPDRHASHLLNLLLEYPLLTGPEPRARAGWNQLLANRFGAQQDDGESPARPYPHWSPSDYSELERIVGGPVEAYPKTAYTVATVEAWQSGHAMVDYIYDPFGLTDDASALSVLADVASADSHVATARRACVLLARECKQKIEDYARNESWWDDGTRPAFDDHRRREGSPTVFAARLVQPTFSQREQNIVAAHIQLADDSPEGALRVLLQQIWRWSDETGECGGAHADPVIHQALATAERCLTRRLNKSHRHRPTMVRAYDITEVEARFLRDDVVWAEPSGNPTPAHRELTKALLWLSNSPIGDELLDRVEFGFERRSQLLVARRRGQAPGAAGGLPEFAMQWPNDPVSDLREGDSIVAANSKFRGDLPVFVEHADGSLEPLARDPEHPYDGWNFGYSGGGPGTLAEAITRVVAASDGDVAGQVHAWIDDQVCHSDKNALRISVDGIRRRSRPRL